MIKYKLTGQNIRTHNGFLWVVGERQTIDTPTSRLCSEGVFHYYASPEQAVLFNPIHADIHTPRLWEVDIDKEVIFDGAKGGCHSMTLLRELSLPEISLTQRAEVAIRCVLLVYTDSEFLLWATRWLSGEDRTAYSASAAADAADAADAAAAYSASAAARSAVDGVQAILVDVLRRAEEND